MQNSAELGLMYPAWVLEPGRSGADDGKRLSDDDSVKLRRSQVEGRRPLFDGAAVLAVTHDIRFAQAIASNALEMDWSGKLSLLKEASNERK